MTSRLSRSVLATVGIGTLFTGAAVGGAAYAVDPDALVEAVTVEGVMTHLEAFQQIADDNDGNRAVGTSGYEASGAYVESVLQAAGYTTERQTFDVVTQEIITYSLTAPGIDPIENPDEPGTFMQVGFPMSSTTGTGPDGITAELVAPIDPLGCDAAAWEGVEAEGKIAVVSRGVCAFGEKSLAAGAAGAVGAILYNNAAGPLNGTLGEEQLPEFVPTTGVSQEEGALILAALAEDGESTATLVIDEETSTATTFNLLAETPTGRDDNTVMLGAHLDSVPEAAGINDNGSGSAAILEVAVQLAEQGELNNQVRFAWWAAEEIGLVGSTHYVNDLVENDPQELEEIATYLNFDMVGSPNYVISVYDADESTHPAPVEVPEGSIQTESVFTDYFDSIDQPWIDTEFSGRSDYQAFIVNGVPSSGLFTGADEEKTAAEAELFGGTVGEIHDQNYHQVGDDIDNINLTALDIMSNAIASATASLANDTSAINGVLPPTEEPEPTPSVPTPSDPAPLPTDAPTDPSAAPAPVQPGGTAGGTTGRPSQLSNTGADVDGSMIGLGFGLLVAGAVAITVAATRRKAAATSLKD